MVILCIFLKVQTIYLSYVSVSFTLQKDKQPILPFVMFFVDVQKLLSPGFYINTYENVDFLHCKPNTIGYFPCIPHFPKKKIN